ncbi:MAG: type II toxin-antitoxin system RelE/ParE family toxin [Microcystaceae cyanobacterium]
MKTNYLPTFIKDIKALKSTPYYETIYQFVFDEVLAYKHLNEIDNVKKLKGEDNAYRIRVGNYRIGFFGENDTITFVRVLHRREFYRYFP